jgi:hypothetical protein
MAARQATIAASGQQVGARDMLVLVPQAQNR